MTLWLCCSVAAALDNGWIRKTKVMSAPLKLKCSCLMLGYTSHLFCVLYIVV